MDNEQAQLTSVATSLDEMVQRVTEIGNELTAAGRESLAHDVIEIERSLRTAQRRLNKLVRRPT